MLLLTLALAPVAIIAAYIYFRDKYEKEPIKILIRAFVAGGVIVIPIILVEQVLGGYWTSKMSGVFAEEGTGLGNILSAAYTGFVVAAFTEEIFKFMALYLLIWRNKNFNERFDGIVYAVFISLGFAAVENILYVFQNGAGTGVLRAFTAVPAHAIFGIAMGFYFGLAKFHPSDHVKLIVMAVVFPIVLHGIYDFILMSGNTYLLLLFIPFVVYMWRDGFKRLKKMSDASKFNPNQKEFYKTDNIE